MTDVTDGKEDMEEEETVNASQKKGGGLFFKSVVVLAAVAGGGFYFMKTSGMPIPFLKKEEVAAVATAPVNVAPDVLPPQQGTENLPAAVPMPPEMPQQPLEQVLAPVPAPVENAVLDAALAPLPDQPLPLMEETVAAAALPAPLNPSPDGAENAVTEDLTAPLPDQGTTEMPAAAVSPVDQDVDVAAEPALQPLAAPIPEASSESFPAPHQQTEKMDEIEGRLAAIEKTLSFLEESMVRPSDLDEIKTQLSDLAQKTKSAARAPKAQPVQSARKEVEDYKKGIMPKVVRVPRLGKESSDVPRHAVSSSRQERAASTAAANWVLRAAKPGMAWVSQKGSGEMKTLSVGDQLAGIGRVTLIAKDSRGQWFVGGTKGRIEQ